jgi:serine/threonine protein kinase
MAEAPAERIVGRYAIHEEIASGGMATVHLGRLMGAVGFTRTVAIKRMHSELAKDPEFVSMFVDEGRLAARIHHPNVVSTLDVVTMAGELFVVMEYIHGESLAALIRTARSTGTPMPLRIVMRIACDLLAGLHAAHEAENEAGESLGIVHRDVSPQNALVGADGSTRVIDFGVAKAAGRISTTREGQLKGKIAYMSPEQILGETVDRRSDVYSASVVLWEMLTGVRLFQGDNQGHTMQRVLAGNVDAPSRRGEVPPAIDDVVMRGLARDVSSRFATALDMAMALEAASPQATNNEVSAWMKKLASDDLRSRADIVSRVESGLGPASGKEVREITATDGGTSANAGADGARLMIRAGEMLTSTTVTTSLASPAAPGPRPRRNRAIAWIGGGTALLLLAVVAFESFAPRGTLPAAIPSTSMGDVPAEPPLAASSLPVPGADAPPLSAGFPVAPPAASMTTRTSPVPAGHGASPRVRTTAPRAGANCNPPFVVDALGVRTYKRECVAP